jgi:adenylate kinase
MAEKYNTIILIGPPGSGKGTVSSFLSLGGAQVHVSMGDVLRALPTDTAENKRIHEVIKTGGFIEDSTIIELWLNHVKGLVASGKFRPGEQDILSDGMPRTANQTKLIEPHIRLKQIILLEAEDEEALWARIARRSGIEGRGDDKRAAWMERYRLYQTQTREVLSCYPESKISRFNALQRPLQVMRDILNRLADLLCEGTTPFPR